MTEPTPDPGNSEPEDFTEPLPDEELDEMRQLLAAEFGTD